jgi:hypothetical protein
MDIEDIMRRLAPDGRFRRNGNGFLVCCPAHRDSTPSLSIDVGDNGAVLLHCFAGCSTKSICAAVGIQDADLFFDPSGRQYERWRPPPPGPPSGGGDADIPTKQSRRARWPEFMEPTAAELRQLAALRSLSTEGLELAANRRLLASCDWQGLRCWAVLDPSRRVAQVRRCDGQPFRVQGGDAKAMTLPGSLVRWPVGLPEIAAFPCVMLCEGGPDFLTAHHFVHVEGREADVGVVAMLGASLTIHPDALSAFGGKAVTIYAQDDRAGLDAAARWLDALKLHTLALDVVSFGGLHQVGGLPVSDLNDATRISADDFEEHRWLWNLCPPAIPSAVGAVAV